MRDLSEVVSEAIRCQRLFMPGEHILVAVSGGLDSMVLLHLLHQLSPQTGWRLTVAHLNHQLRGRSSQADERLVQRIAGALSLPVVVEHQDVRALSGKGKGSVEMVARRARHEFLARTALRLGIRVVALAHHADDQLELFLLRLLRGSGSQGLGGMNWKNFSPMARQVGLARPLLAIPKEELRQYARHHQIRYREDASNACLDILRNRVRHHLLPLIKRRYQRALPQIISRTAEILRAESEYVESAAAEWLDQVRRQAGHARLRRGRRTKPDTSQPRRFDSLHVSVQRRCLQAQLIALGVVPDYELTEKLRKACGLPVSIGLGVGKGQLGGGQEPGARKRSAVLVSRDATGVLHLRQAEPIRMGFSGGSMTCDLTDRSGSATFDGVKLSWKLKKGAFLPRSKHLVRNELFDADKVGSSAILRHWRPGDRFQPIGSASAIKLQDLYTNQKVPRALRRQLIVATTAQGEIFWVEGLRISERFKLTTKTIRCLHWAWQRL